MELISTTTLSSTQSSVTFSNLNVNASTYRHLRVVGLVRAATDSTAQSIVVELNGDTGSNYTAHSMYTFVSGSGVIANSWLYVNQPSSSAYCGGAEGLLAFPNSWTANIWELNDFSQTNKNKYIVSSNGITNSATNAVSSWNNLMWNSTAAVTSIKFSLPSNFASGSRFSLYGIK